MSEEFLRKYEAGEDFGQTIDEAVPVGQELFEDVAGKREHNLRQRQETNADQPVASEQSTEE